MLLLLSLLLFGETDEMREVEVADVVLGAVCASSPALAVAVDATARRSPDMLRSVRRSVRDEARLLVALTERTWSR